MKTYKNKIAAALLASLVLAGCGTDTSAAAPAVEEATDAVTEQAQGLIEEVIENSTLADILSRGYINFATEGTYAPYSYHDDNDELVGYDVDIARAIADKLGVEARFTETQWDSIIAGLDAKKYDAISNQVSITDERKEKYLFSDPYTYAYGVLIVTDDNTDINSFEDVDGKKLAQTITSNWAKLGESYGAEIVSTNGFSDSIQLVLQGRADGTINDNVTYLEYLKEQPDSKVRIAAQSEDASESAVLIRKEDVDLQAAINAALKVLVSEGKLKEISEKYFGEDISSAS